MAVMHQEGLSTAVRIRLEIAGMVLPVSQVGGDSLILRDAQQLSPTSHAQVVISIDGDEIVYPIEIAGTIFGKRVTFTDRPVCHIRRNVPAGSTEDD